MENPPDRLGEAAPLADRAAPAYPIASVDNTLRILLLLRERKSLALTDVAAELGIARSSAHRLMAMLSYYDFVRQEPASRSFRPGPALIDFALAAIRSFDLRALARPILTELAETTRMTASLALPRGRDVLYIDGVESRGTIRAALRTGETLPAHVTGVGKALLAQLTDDQLAQLFRDEPPQALTPRSVRSLEGLLAEARRIRRKGYAVNRAESEQGVMAMGIALKLTEPGTYAGISLVCPESAVDSGWEARVSTQLKAAAEELGESIGAYRYS
jgi:DNA-binding IclR family transcriptional regulator